MNKRIIFGLFAVILLFCSALPSLGFQKAVEGYVFKGQERIEDSKITILMEFNENDKKITCLSFPTVFTDNRGYFITNLANLRVLGNNEPCSDKWKKGDILAVIAGGFYTEIPDKNSIIIDSESGEAITLERLDITDRKFEAMYSQLSLARLRIDSLNYTLSPKTKKAIFDAVIHNPNNVPLEDVYLKIIISNPDDRTDILKIEEQRFGIDAFDKKEVQIIMDTDDIGYGTYRYDAVLYTTTMNNDQATGHIEIQPFMGIFNIQNMIIMVMALVIALLAIMLLKSSKKKRRKK